MNDLLQDLRYALRQLRGNPGFTTVAVLVLALGIGANASLFSVINAVLLRPLPFPNASDVAALWESNLTRGETEEPVAPDNFIEWQKQSRSISEMAVYEHESYALVTREGPQRMQVVLASGRFFDVFGVRPLLGRTFTADDDRPGAHAAVLSYRSWRTHFNSDPNIVGKAITLDREPYTVIGVMPAEFQFPARGTDVWSAPAFDLKTDGNNHFLYGVARIRHGMTLAQSQAELSTIAHRLEQAYPDRNRGDEVKLVQLQEEMVGGFRHGLMLLWRAVTLVLLIGCANVAHLLLARSAARQKELAIRAALGAGQGRLIRQLLTESVMLAGAAGVVGIGISVGGIRLLLAGGGRIVPRTEGIHVDGVVLAFTAVISLLTAVVFGLLPALRASRQNLAAATKQSGGDARLAGGVTLRSALVVSEMALSVMLLIGAGLLLKSFWRLQHVNPGFDPANVLGMRVSLPEAQYREPTDRALLYQRIIDRIEAVPGVESAGATNDLPYSGSRTSSSFEIFGRANPPEEVREADYRTVSAEYLQTMRILLLKGREFSEADNRRKTPGVVIINDALRRRFWPQANPVGQRLIFHGDAFEIIGVVGNVRHADLTAEGGPEIYIPQYQGHTPPWSFIAVKSRTPVEALVPAIRNAVREVAPEEPLYDLRTMEERLSGSIAPQRFNAFALALFAGFALLLAMIGIYGVVAYSVEQRTREMGVRMAIGARPADVLRLVLGQGVALGMAGVAIGIVAALVANRLIASMLYGTRASDPETFVGVGIVFLGITVVACYVPARRAARVDPMVALRWE